MDIEDIQYEIEGTCKTLDQIIEEFELDFSADELQDVLLNGSHSVEISGCCGYWFASSDLEFDEEKNAGVCETCCPELFVS